MIPVLGVPILVKPDLLYRMLNSIDVEVGQIVVIDNGNVVYEPHLKRGEHLVRMPGNLGVAASWNFVIKSTPRAPWWALVGFDIVFAPGDLARLATHMETVGGVALLGTFSAFGIDRAAVERVGWFDENFIPAYYEDNDFDYRCRLAGVPLTGLPAGLSHTISSTISAGHVYVAENGRTFSANAAYYERKWGGHPRSERYTTPFDEGGDHRVWSLDIARLAELSWHL
jgi:GT2 family glycosyltransferase